MHRTRVKICGLTRPSDLALAVAAGADAIGLIFYPPSPRFLSIEKAVELLRPLPAFVTAVGLFLDAEPAWVRAVLDRVPLDLLQFHGKESPQECRSFGRPYMKALGMGGKEDIHALAREYGDAAALLLDSHAPGAAGGTGLAFDWSKIPNDLPRPVVLAGGLGPQNVRQAVRVVRPYAVDVSSGVELAPGVKNPRLIESFIHEVNCGDSE